MVLNHLFEGSVLGILYLEDLIHLEVNTISFQGRSFLEFGLLIIVIIITAMRLVFTRIWGVEHPRPSSAPSELLVHWPPFGEIFHMHLMCFHN